MMIFLLEELKLQFFEDTVIDHFLQFIIEGCDNSVSRRQCLCKQRSRDSRLHIDPLEEDYC